MRLFIQRAVPHRLFASSGLVVLALTLALSGAVGHAGTPTKPIITIRGVSEPGTDGQYFLHLDPDDADQFGNGRAEMYRLPVGSRRLEFVVKFNQVSNWPQRNTFLTRVSGSTNEWIYLTEGMKAFLLNTDTGARTPVLFDPNPSVPTRYFILGTPITTGTVTYIRRSAGTDLTIERSDYGAEASTVISTLDRNDPAIAGALVVSRPYRPGPFEDKFYCEVLKNDGGFTYSVIEIDYTNPTATATFLREGRLPAFVERTPDGTGNIFVHRAIDGSRPTEINFTNFETGSAGGSPADVGFDWVASSLEIASTFYGAAELVTAPRWGGNSGQGRGALETFTRIRRASNAGIGPVQQQADIEIDFPSELPPVQAYIDDLINIAPITEGQYDNPDRNNDSIIDVADLVFRVNELNP